MSKIPIEFNEFYRKIFASRWENILAALLACENTRPRRNFFSSGEPEFVAGQPISRGTEGLLHYYVMDPSSVEVANALGVQQGDQVLDMCAAPGGKSLVLFEALSQAGSLVANDVSAARRERLKKVFQQYVPKEQRMRISITGKDGGLFSIQAPQRFNRVLVDAPCSGERYLLATPSELKIWNPKRSKKLAFRQYALLASAFQTASVGGRFVYSTCALSPFENDEVVRQLLEKREQSVRIVKDISVGLNGIEETEFGFQFLPDQSGYGPIYFAVFEKISL